MKEGGAVGQFDRIVFVDTMRGKPDRGWTSENVASTLERRGITCSVICVRSAAELQEIASTAHSCLYWPLSFTFDTDPRSATIVDALHSISQPYVGCDPFRCSLTSKLRFKHALAEAGLAVPSHQVLDGQLGGLENFTYPGFLKAEFSCDSQGVRLVRTALEANEAMHELALSFHHDLFLEEVAGTTEWTIGCIVIGGRCLSASLGLQALDGGYIDATAKTDNSLLRVSVPEPTEAERLSKYASTLVERLRLTGYFRVDLFTGSKGSIMPIDLNLLPHLNCAPAHLSYLPMAFMLETGCSYDEVVAAVIATALHPDSQAVPGSAVEDFLCSSRLLERAGVRLR